MPTEGLLLGSTSSILLTNLVVNRTGFNKGDAKFVYLGGPSCNSLSTNFLEMPYIFAESAFVIVACLLLLLLLLLLSRIPVSATTSTTTSTTASTASAASRTEVVETCLNSC